MAKAWKLNKPSRGTRILFEKLLPSQAGAAATEAATLLKPKLHFHHTIQSGEPEKNPKRRILVHFL